jgi:hypothetical protein
MNAPGFEAFVIGWKYFAHESWIASSVVSTFSQRKSL